MPSRDALSTQATPTPPNGYQLISSKSPAAPKKSVKELKLSAEKLKPISPPSGYILQAAPAPSVIQQLRDSVANSAIGHSVESTLPKLADALNLHPSETVNSPTYASDKEQLIAPQYMAPAIEKYSVMGQERGRTQADKERMEGALTAAGGLTSGESMATLAGTAVGAGLTAGIINPVSAQLLSRLVSGGFTLDMLHGLYQQHVEYRKAVGSGNLAEAHKIQGEMGVTGIIALLTGKHALTAHPIVPVADTASLVRDRERTNILHKSPLGQVRQNPGQAPTVWLEPKAWQAYMEAFHPGEEHQDVNGVVLAQRDDMQHILSDPNASKSEHWPEVQKMIATANKVAGDEGIAVGAKRGKGIQHTINIMREELNHTAQRKVAGSLRGLIPNETYNSLHGEIPKGMVDYMKSRDYDLNEPVTTVSEATAKLMGGNAEDFGVSPEEKKKFLTAYFTEIAKNHGVNSLDTFKHLMDSSKEIKEQVHAEHSGKEGASGADAGLAVNRPDGSSLQSVSGGGQGGTEQIHRPAGSEVDQGTAEEAPLFNRDKDKPTWYLKSERLIGDKMKGPAPAEDVHKMLISGGVKPEEMQWTGLDDFLKSKGKDKVTPEEVREHLANNNIQVKEVTKGGTKPVEWKSYPNGTLYTPEGYKVERIPGNGMYRLSDPSGMTSAYDTVDEAKAQVDTYRKNTHEDVVPTKFPTLVMPGAEPNSYREMLLTMPARTPHADALAEFRDKSKEKYGFPIVTEEGAKRFDPAEREEYGKLVKAADEEHAKTPPPFHVRAHWDEANPLAHARFNDRTGPNGEKLLHVEEVQSDWHQKGRDKGYQLTPEQIAEAKKNRAEHNALQTRLAEKYGTVAYGNMLTPEELVELKASGKKLDYETEAGKSPAGSVPDAPFKKTWHEMALRRLVKHAVDNGYEGVSWTGGEDQNSRYNLSKQVKKIAVPMVNENGTRSVRIEPIDGGHSFNMMVASDGTVDGTMYASQFTGKKLDEIVGKDLANKIMEAKVPTDFEGEGLNVGGSGMRGFYDKIVPDYLNKFGKKFGAKVGETEFPVPGDKRITIRRGINGWDVESRIDENVGREQGLAFFSDEDYGGKEGAQKAAQKDAEDRTTPKKKVQYLPITPEMRQSVGQEGVPLFNREKSPDALENDAWERIAQEIGNKGKTYNRDIEEALKAEGLPHNKGTQAFTAISKRAREIGEQRAKALREERLAQRKASPEYQESEQELKDAYGDEWDEMTEDERHDAVESDLDRKDEEREEEEEKQRQSEEYDRLLEKKVAYMDEKQQAVEDELTKRGFTFSSKGRYNSSRYITVDSPDEDGMPTTIRISDHEPAVGLRGHAVGGYNIVTGDRHDAADVSFHPGEDDLSQLDDVLPENPSANKDNTTFNREKPNGEPKFDTGSTQINIRDDSDAGKALEAARNAIPKDELVPSSTFGGNEEGIEDHPHVTVKFGLKGDLTPKLRKYIEGLSPFDAKLGKLQSFAPNAKRPESAVIYAPIDSPEMHKINGEIAEHGDWKPSDFPDYKPHATLAYVKPEAAKKYVGDDQVEGKTFPVDHIAISDRNGKVTEIPLKGGADKSPEPVEVGSTGTTPPAVIPIQGGTQLASAPVQEPVVPIATKPTAKVLPLSQVKVLAAGLLPNHKQHTVKNVRDLMAEARSRMGNSIVP